MRRFLAILAVGLFLGIGAAANTASATTINLNPNPTALFSDSVGSGGFSQDYDFTIGGVSDVAFGVVSVGIHHLTGALYSDSTFSTLVAPTSGGIGGNVLFSLGGFTYSSLASGTYYLLVSGAGSFLGGAYLGVVGVSPSVAATPLPPAALMFLTALIGLGFLGYQRRKAASSFS